MYKYWKWLIYQWIYGNCKILFEWYKTGIEILNSNYWERKTFKVWSCVHKTLGFRPEMWPVSKYTHKHTDKERDILLFSGMIHEAAVIRRTGLLLTALESSGTRFNCQFLLVANNNQLYYHTLGCFWAWQMGKMFTNDVLTINTPKGFV